jgi:DNA polymerase
MLVGEQPGDKEDRDGHPFVGPAGALLHRALAEAKIDRDEVYVTNAVKHFKWVPSGKRRIHKTPAQAEIAACVDWLEQEIALEQPRVILCMGGTAARAVLGRPMKVTLERHITHRTQDGRRVRVTVHPSSILRVRDETQRHAALARFVLDLNAAIALARRQR